MEILNKKGFVIICKNCKSEKIQCDMFADEGYSNYTVTEEGAIEFKCLDCGKFGSSYEYKKPNEFENFLIRCVFCNSQDDFDFNIQDVERQDNKTNITCKKCGNRVLEQEDHEKN